MPIRKKPIKARVADRGHPLARVLDRIADSLERAAPKALPRIDLSNADAFVWSPEHTALKPVAKVNRVPLNLLRGIETQTQTLLANTQRHAQGLPANNALLWGARGTGKSSLVKSVHAEVNKGLRNAQRLILVEIHREDIPSLPTLLSLARELPRQLLVLCDDLSFEGQDTSYKALKSALEGGIEGRPTNVVLYATSNRRHLMARDMIENERAVAIHDTESIEEKVSLSDRFGLWLGFHHLDQDTYLNIIAGYADAIGLSVPAAELRAKAIEWSMTRGARSGRVAWQFIQDQAGANGVEIKL